MKLQTAVDLNTEDYILQNKMLLLRANLLYIEKGIGELTHKEENMQNYFNLK